MAYIRRPLQEGDRIRLREDGPIRTVKRVSVSAAYVSGEPKSATIKCDDCRAKLAAGDEATPDCPNCRTFSGAAGVEAISRNAFVFEGVS